jgi:hypothetical protein
MAQAHSPVPSSHPSVEQVAGAINAMIAECAAERLQRNAPGAQAAVKTPPAGVREPGVNFGLSMADYRADPSLGSTDLKRLLQAPAVYWWHSWMNPDRPPSPDSPARQKGRALHKLVLEGPEAFEAAFVTEPRPEAHPGALVTLDDLKARGRDLGEPVSGTKADLAKRIKAKDAGAIIFDDILALFRAMVDRVWCAGHSGTINPMATPHNALNVLRKIFRQLSCGRVPRCRVNRSQSNGRHKFLLKRQMVRCGEWQQREHSDIGTFCRSEAGRIRQEVSHGKL